MVRGGPEQMRMKLFAHVQAMAGIPVLEKSLMNRESMGTGAPQSRAVLEDLLRCIEKPPPLFELRSHCDSHGAQAH